MQTTNEILGPFGQGVLAQIVADATTGLDRARRELMAETLVVFEKAGDVVQVVRVTPLSDEASSDKDVCLEAAEDRLTDIELPDSMLCDDDDFFWTTENVSVRNVRVATQVYGTGRTSGITILVLRLPDIVWAQHFPGVCGRLVGIYELEDDRPPRIADAAVVCCEYNIAHHTAAIEARWRSRAIKMMVPRRLPMEFGLSIEIKQSGNTGLPSGTAYLVKWEEGSRKKKAVVAWTVIHIGRDQLLEISNREEEGVDELPDLDSDGPAMDAIASTILRIDL